MSGRVCVDSEFFGSNDNVVNANPLIIANGIRRNNASLNKWLIINHARQRNVDRAHFAPSKWPLGCVSHETTWDVRKVTRIPNAILQSDGLNRIVRCLVNVEKSISDRDV